MFKIDKNIRRLSQNEINQFEKDGYLTGLPLFDKLATEELNNFFTSLSSRLDESIDLNQSLKGKFHTISLISIFYSYY